MKAILTRNISALTSRRKMFLKYLKSAFRGCKFNLEPVPDMSQLIFQQD